MDSLELDEVEQVDGRWEADVVKSQDKSLTATKDCEF